MGTNFHVKKGPDSMTIDIKPEAFGFSNENVQARNILDSYNRLSNLTGRNELGYELLYANQISNTYSNEYTDRIDLNDQDDGIFGGAKKKKPSALESVKMTIVNC